MPLTADHFDLGRIDATDVTDAQWASIHRQRPAPPLTCRGCCAPMTARVSCLGLRHFAHRRKPDQACPSYGEGELHLSAKRIVADTVRQVPGWVADLEVAGPGWRADVLAVGPDGQRIAFEVQVSSINDAVADERTRRHTGSGNEVVWLDYGNHPAIAAHNAIRAERTANDEHRVRVARFGLGRRPGPEPHWHDTWTSLPVVVAGVCAGTVVRHYVRPGGVWLSSGFWVPPKQPSFFWTHVQYVRLEEADEPQRQEQQAQRQRHAEELEDRKQRMICAARERKNSTRLRNVYARERAEGEHRRAAAALRHRLQHVEELQKLVLRQGRSQHAYRHSPAPNGHEEVSLPQLAYFLACADAVDWPDNDAAAHRALDVAHQTYSEVGWVGVVAAARAAQAAHGQTETDGVQ